MSQQIREIGFINILKVFGISLVLLGHLVLPELKLLFVNSFHMPLFFFLSGYLITVQKYGLKLFIWKKFKTLIIPYLFFAFVTFTFWYFFNRKYNPTTDHDPLKYLIGIFCAIPTKEYLGFNMPLWFLPSLFCAEIIFYLYQKYYSNYGWFVSILFFILGMIVKFFLSFRFPFGIDVSFFAIIFIQFGYWFRNKKMIEKYILHLKYFFRLFFTCLFGIITLYLAWINGKSGYISIYMLHFNNYFLFLTCSLSGILFALFFSSFFHLDRFFRFYGRNTIVVLALHLMCFSLLKGIQLFIFKIPLEVLDGTFWPNIAYVVITFIILTPVIWFINRFSPFLLGRPQGIY